MILQNYTVGPGPDFNNHNMPIAINASELTNHRTEQYPHLPSVSLNNVNHSINSMHDTVKGHLKENTKQDHIREEWKMVSMVFDRLFFLLVVSALLTITFFFVSRRPSLTHAMARIE